MVFVQLTLFSKALSRLTEKLRAVTLPASPPQPARRRRSWKEAPELKAIWLELQKEYFPGRTELGNFSICWSSRRQLRTLASCNAPGRKVTVARELNTPSCAQWLPPLLYHEMCHAVLAEQVRASRGKMKYHGREFKQLERQHPLVKELNRWIRAGGWIHAVRSHRAKEVHEKKRLREKAA